MSVDYDTTADAGSKDDYSCILTAFGITHPDFCKGCTFSIVFHGNFHTVTARTKQFCQMCVLQIFDTTAVSDDTIFCVDKSWQRKGDSFYTLIFVFVINLSERFHEFWYRFSFLGRGWVFSFFLNITVHTHPSVFYKSSTYVKY